MKTFDVMVPGKKIMEEYNKFLVKENYGNIKMNFESGEISAERTNGLFKENENLRLVVRPVDHEVTKIELTINPEHTSRTETDEAMEENLENRIFSRLF